jgi:hypothetical protein
MLKVTADNCPSAYLSIIALEMFTNKLYPTRTHVSMGALVNFPLTLEIGALNVHQKPWRSCIFGGRQILTVHTNERMVVYPGYLR